MKRTTPRFFETKRRQFDNTIKDMHFHEDFLVNIVFFSHKTQPYYTTEYVPLKSMRYFVIKYKKFRV